jgi:hypothetical protein
MSRPDPDLEACDSDPEVELSDGAPEKAEQESVKPEIAPSLLKRLREKLAKAEKNDPNIYPLY